MGWIIAAGLVVYLYIKVGHDGDAGAAWDEVKDFARPATDAVVETARAVWGKIRANPRLSALIGLAVIAVLIWGGIALRANAPEQEAIVLSRGVNQITDACENDVAVCLALTESEASGWDCDILYTPGDLSGVSVLDIAKPGSPAICVRPIQISSQGGK